MGIDFAALNIELVSDPTGRGYSGNSDVGMAALANEIQGSIQINRGELPTWEIVAGTVKSEYDALSAADKQLYQIIVSTGIVDASDSRIRAMFASLFAAPTATRANLIAVSTRNGSRAEQLFNASVSHGDVARALGRF